MRYILLLLVVGCASVNTEFFTLQKGDSREVVLGKMGAPIDRQFSGDNEVLQYCTTGTGFGSSTFNVVWLHKSKVVATSSYTKGHGGLCQGHFNEIDWQSPDLTVEIR